MFRTPIRGFNGLTVVALLCGAAQVQAGFVTSILPATDYNSNTAVMDTTLGITGYSTYNFGTTTFGSGLTSINLQNFASGPNLTDTSLPALYNPSQEVVNGQSTSSNLWAGTYAFNNTAGNVTSEVSGHNYAQFTTFNFAAGVTSVGIGLASFQSLSLPPDEFPVTDHGLLINGVLQSETLEQIGGTNWTPGIFGLNGYLEVNPSAGSTIQSIGFENLTGQDFLVFSHLAISSVPEPSSLVLCGIACLGGIAYHIRRRASSKRGHSRVGKENL
jgi:hypothetical protein